jgi:hypothetical protein
VLCEKSEGQVVKAGEELTITVTGLELTVLQSFPAAVTWHWYW